MEDTVVDERLILKFLNPSISQDEEMMQRFVHELRYSRKITHPNVIRIYDFLHIRGNYAISMEYFPSHTLGGEVSDGKPLAQRRAVRLGMDVAKGMSVAHAVGIVHRDLKPANVLINDEGVVKIVDFGVAAAQHQGDTQLTKTGYVIGSPKYMAPEQILGKKVDERADIYSLGVILYEMLTGHAALPPRRPHVGHVPARAGPRPAADRAEPFAAAGNIRPRHEVHGRGQGEAIRDHGRGQCGARTVLVIHSRRNAAHRRLPEARFFPGML
jgi:serine/threonine protein kinase